MYVTCLSALLDGDPSSEREQGTDFLPMIDAIMTGFVALYSVGITHVQKINMCVLALKCKHHAITHHADSDAR
jgi:hypothetical protein